MRDGASLPSLQEKTLMSNPRTNTIDQTKYYREKDAIKEGWFISAADDGFQLQRIDDPAEWPGFNPEKVKPFETDDAVFEHVVARAWAGSPNHRSALDFLSRVAPAEYSRTGDEALKTASVLYRRAEEERFQAEFPALRDKMASDPDLKFSLSEAYLDLAADLDRKHAATPGLKSYEAHHANSVAQEAFLLGYLDSGTPEGALDAARRRMLLTATPHEFYRDALAEPAKDNEADAPSL